MRNKGIKVGSEKQTRKGEIRPDGNENDRINEKKECRASL
jgi:hypothetical protein